MKTLTPYLLFAGNCREAINYYREVLNGEITQIQTFGEIGYKGSDQEKFKQLVGSDVGVEVRLRDWYQP